MRRCCRALVLLLALAFALAPAVLAVWGGAMAAGMSNPAMADGCDRCDCDDGDPPAMMTAACFDSCLGPIFAPPLAGIGRPASSLQAVPEQAAAMLTAITAPEPYPPKSAIAV